MRQQRETTVRVSGVRQQYMRAAWYKTCSAQQARSLECSSPRVPSLTHITSCSRGHLRVLRLRRLSAVSILQLLRLDASTAATSRRTDLSFTIVRQGLLKASLLCNSFLTSVGEGFPCCSSHRSRTTHAGRAPRWVSRLRLSAELWVALRSIESSSAIWRGDQGCRQSTSKTCRKSSLLDSDSPDVIAVPSAPANILSTGRAPPWHVATLR